MIYKLFLSVIEKIKINIGGFNNNYWINMYWYIGVIFIKGVEMNWVNKE